MAKHFSQNDSGLLLPDAELSLPGRQRARHDVGQNRSMSRRRCCCPSCTIFSDDFTADDLATNWTQQAGSWSIGSGVLSTSSSDAILTCNTSYPGGGFHNHVIQVSLKASTGDRSRIIFSYVDSSNYNFVEVYWNTTSSYVYIKQKVAGTISTVATSAVQSFTNGSWYDFKVCTLTNGAVVNFGTGTPTVLLGVVPTTTDVDGVGTGTITSGGDFDNFLISYVATGGNGCPQCVYDCTICTSQPPPENFLVKTSGISNAACSDCAGLNGDFVLQRSAPLGGDTCHWQYIFPSTICSLAKLNFYAYGSGSSIVAFSAVGGTDYISWFTNGFTCFNGPFSGTPWMNLSGCNVSSATVTIEAA
jgi:hypothetical protein